MVYSCLNMDSTFWCAANDETCAINRW